MDASLDTLSADVLKRHGDFVRALARELLADEHEGEDLAQEAWVRFLRRPPAAGAVKGWLRRVTRNLSVERLRGRARVSAREERVAREEALPSVVEELAQTEVLGTVVEAVLALEEPYKTSVLLAYWRGWDARRIARETGAPLATVRSRLQRAHGKLRERLDRAHGREAWSVALAALPGVEAGAAFALAGVGAVALFTWLGVVLVRNGGLAQEAIEPVEVAQQELDGSEPGAALAPAAVTTTSTRIPVVSKNRIVRVTGFVRTSAGAELTLAASASVGSLVQWAFRRSGFDEEPLARGELRTDAEGRFGFEFEDSREEECELLLRCEDDGLYREAFQRVEVFAQETLTLELVRAPYGVLHGTVVDDAGAPLGGITLALGDELLTSGPDGAFSRPGAARQGARFEPRARGWSLVGHTPVTPLAAGGYEPVVVTLAPEAELELVVRDLGGDGIEGVRVQVSLAQSELAPLATTRDGASASSRSVTDADGRARVTGLCAGRKLALRLLHGYETLNCDAMEDGVLLVGDKERGQPIVIRPGERLDLRYDLAVELPLAGVVTLPDGTRVPDAKLEVVDLGTGEEWGMPRLLELTSDAEGAFAGTLRASRVVGPLRITASAPELAERQPAQEYDGRVQELGYAGDGGTTPLTPTLTMPSAVVELAPDARDALAALTFVLRPRGDITGKIFGRDGLPLGTLGSSNRLWAVHSGTSYHGHGAAATVWTDGRFALRGLEPGPYDLVLSEELQGWYSFENFAHRFEGIETGSVGLELRLGERAEARLTLRLASPGRVVALRGDSPLAALVLVRRVYPPAGFDAPRASRSLVIRGACGWPEGASLGFAGIGGARLGTTQAVDGYDSFAGPAHTTQPLQPGFYVIGLACPGAYPQATEVLFFEAGEHELVFDPLPAATLRGRILGARPDEFLALQLVDDAGHPVPLATFEGFTNPTTLVETDSHGRFVLRSAPSGTFRLRVGTRAELTAGRWRSETELELRPGENGPVEVGG
jgi:RNA polymerase sigma-70 factor (ECF subfamily)